MNQKPNENTPKVNRVLYIVTVTLLFAVAVVIAVTSAAQRGSKNPPPNTSEADSGTNSPITSQLMPETSMPETETKKPVVNDTKPSTTPAAEQLEEIPPEPVDVMPESFILPAAGALAKGHDSTLQVFSKTMNDYRVHTGIDIACAEGAPVHASADGVISKIWDDPLMGTSIAIEHSGSCFTVYKNLSKEIPEEIEEGTEVNAGQLIASVGNTAMIEIAEEPHLHFEMTVAGKSANPLDYFDDAALTSLETDITYES